MKQKKTYVAPGLTVVQFRMERGYAASMTEWSVSQVASTINDQLAQQALLDEENNLAAASMDGQFDYTNAGASSDWHYTGNGSSWF